MSRVRGRDTKPEMILRRMVHGMGYRYRLHRRDLPGTPDLVFPKLKKVIFVHGCFWHRHKNCRLARLPKSRVEFWTSKLNANAERDQRNIEALKTKGWLPLIVWECELSDSEGLKLKLTEFLGSEGAQP